MISPDSQPQLVGRELRRSFRLGSRTIDVLRGITVEIQKGEAVFLCGASGAGKTTLLYTLAGLEQPEAGDVIFVAMIQQRLYLRRQDKQPLCPSVHRPPYRPLGRTDRDTPLSLGLGHQQIAKTFGCT